MHDRKVWRVGVVALASTGLIAFSLIRGQEKPSTVHLKVLQAESQSTALDSTAKSPGQPDLKRLSLLQQQMYLSAQRGAEWLRRTNRPAGRFASGYVPALKTLLEGDPYLPQIGATLALARAGHFLRDEQYIALARQAVLTLLLDTASDSSNPTIRYTTFPSVAVNRLGAAGLLVAAINELPTPGADLLEQSEQLSAFIRTQQAADGALNCAEAEAQPLVESHGINLYPGQALYGLMCSQRHRPAEWKWAVLRRALPYYRASWEKHRTTSCIPWQTAACAEAYLLTKDSACADFVYLMNDWLCTLQYAQLDPRHPLWSGGFTEWANGQPLMSAPQVTSATYGESLAAACRVARHAGDLSRYQRYREALERCLQFLVTLQYTDANTQHFVDWYRPVLLGGFFASHQDGNLRLDYTQHAVSALVQYLMYVGVEN